MIYLKNKSKSPISYAPVDSAEDFSSVEHASGKLEIVSNDPISDLEPSKAFNVTMNKWELSWMTPIVIKWAVVCVTIVQIISILIYLS